MDARVERRGALGISNFGWQALAEAGRAAGTQAQAPDTFREKECVWSVYLCHDLNLRERGVSIGSSEYRFKLLSNDWQLKLTLIQ